MELTDSELIILLEFTTVIKNCGEGRSDELEQDIVTLHAKLTDEILRRWKDKKKMNLDQIAQAARVTHEANRAYCFGIGDESQVPYEEAPIWQKQSALNGVKFHLAQLEAGNDPLPSASHENWLKEKEADGWKFGPVKDAEKKEHPCFVPYAELPIEQRAKDYIFGAIVKALYEVSLL